MNKWKVWAYRVALEMIPCMEKPAKCTGDVPRSLPRTLHCHHAVDGAVAVFDGKGVTGLCLYGNAKEETYFRAASISKHITAMAAWRLHEAGQIDLDADVDGYLPCSLRHPQAPQTPITLRRLLSHTAGIHDGKSYGEACQRSLPLSQVMRGDSHTAAFGGFEYSNLGAGIAACALEGMLGKSFEDIMQEAVFGPEHVTASFYPQKIAGNIANTYRVLPPSRKPLLDTAARRARPLPENKPDPEHHYLLSQGNLYITAPGLARLGQELLRERYAGMRRHMADFGERDAHLSMGLSTFIVRGILPQTVYGHQGLAYGAMHGLFYDPAAGRGFVLLTSGCSEARLGVLSDVNIALMRLILDGNRG